MILEIAPPPPLNARIVFTASGASWISRAIMFDEMGAVSHAAAMMDDGLLVTANIGEGVQRKRPIDELAGVTMAINVDIPMPWQQYAKWRDFLYSRVGHTYDTISLVGQVTRFDLHTQGALICSALQVDALRHCGYFERPLAQRYHAVTPVVLLLMLQALPLSTGVIVHDPQLLTPPHK